MAQEKPMRSSGEQIIYFAQTDSRSRRIPFGIKAGDRSRHVYVIGKTGMGKSTMLENMAIQDIRNGNGLAFIDPHGKTAELLLDYVPAERVKDVLYFAPFDTDFPVSFNVMEDVGPDKRHLVSNGLMSAFKKIWVDAWSARMEYILNNILLALLEYPDSTLLGVNRMLADKDYRKKVVDNITDVSVKSFWTDEFARYGDRYMQEAGAAIQNKIGQFISNPLIRNIIGQPKSTFDLRTMMDTRKIIIVNLSKGRMGEANANLLGSMLITKVYLAALSRADRSEVQLNKLPSFCMYVDEFQSFANESFADVLSESRKYKLSLIMAHQYIEQMSDEVRAAVFGNVGTMVSFRVGAYDAEVLEKEFAPQFTAQDMVNLGQYQAYLKLMIDGVTSPPFSATTLPPIQKEGVSYRDAIISLSRSMYARARDAVETEIREWHSQKEEDTTRRDERGKRIIPAPRRDNPPERREHRDAHRDMGVEHRATPRAEAPRREERIIERERPPEKNVEKPVDRRQSEARMQQAVSLDYLKKQHQTADKKAPSEKHLLDLREALKAAGIEPTAKPVPTPNTAAVPAAPQKEIPAAPKPPESKPETKKEQSAAPKAYAHAAGQKEVPEEVLRRLLDKDS